MSEQLRSASDAAGVTEITLPPSGGRARIMSLRDHFAAQALAAAAIPIYAENQDEVAAACYSMADAMLRARGDAK